MKKLLTKILIATMALLLAVPAVSWAGSRQKGNISILFSHDMHSHLEKFGKIKTVADAEKTVNPRTFLLDGGDFSMGTPYQTIFKKKAGELRMMGAVGYDATTLGNHEFDYRSKGVYAMLNAAKDSGDKLPQLVVSNIDWKGTLEDANLKADGENLQKALAHYGAEQEYLVLEKGGAKIAVFGLFGEEAASYAPESGTYFKSQVETAQVIVEKIRAEEDDVDLVVCLSHCGTDEDNPKDSEDEILAENVDGINLIISGHSHTRLEEPILIGDTVIASVGQYNDNLGRVTFTEKDGRYVMQSYQLIKLDKSVKNDAAVMEQVDGFKDLVDEHYFGKYGYRWEQVLVDNPVAFTDIETFSEEQGEDPLGSLIADSYKYGVKEAEGGDYVPVDVAVAPSGVIRGSFAKGDVTVADAFNALSLGTGRDGMAGYPLVSVYLSGKELKLAAEIDISISPVMTPARLYLSGLNYTYNPNRMILNKAYDIRLSDEDGNLTEPEDEKLYRVVADLYSAQMLGTVNSMSYGLLSIVPKDKDGNEITDYEEHIIYRQDGSELKEWYALAGYLDHLNPEEIAARYSRPEGRKVLEDSKNIGDLLKQPNKFFWMIIGVIAVVILVAALVVRFIVRRVKRRKKK